MATLLALIHSWTTVEPFEPVWPFGQGTGTTDQANHWPLNQIWHHSPLVWQLPITECRINKHGAHLSEWQHPSQDKVHDDDDDVHNRLVTYLICGCVHVVMIGLVISLLLAVFLNCVSSATTWSLNVNREHHQTCIFLTRMKRKWRYSASLF